MNATCTIFGGGKMIVTCFRT